MINTLEEVKEFLKDIECKDYRFEPTGGYSIRIWHDTLDSRSSNMLMTGVEIRVPAHLPISESMLLRSIYDGVIRLEIHEISEWFMYRGRAPYDEHGEIERKKKEFEYPSMDDYVKLLRKDWKASNTNNTSNRRDWYYRDGREEDATSA